jgi:anti-anti-sigma regulatory factor
MIDAGGEDAMSARDSKAIKQRAKLAPSGRIFSHDEASRVFSAALYLGDVQQIVIDLGAVEDATTSAFAELVLLRRRLLRKGRDLCLTNLRARAAGLFEVNRLHDVLPCV